jgi:hypothetical protein
VQAGRVWNEELNSHMMGEGLASTPQDPTIYMEHWDRENFVAGGSWVDNFVRIGLGRRPKIWLRGFDAKYG